MKRKYEKPSMKVYQLQHRTMILCGSGYDDEVYAPGIGIWEDKNRLA